MNKTKRATLYILYMLLIITATITICMFATSILIMAGVI